jgi:hypothetical protein
VPANAQPRGQNYSVKNAETVAAGKDLRVRLFTLAPGEVIPWHFHSAIDDEFFVLDGELTVETRASDDYRAVARISHTKRRIGAANQRKLLCRNDFRGIRREPRCRQSVARNALILELSKIALWKPRLMAAW